MAQESLQNNFISKEEKSNTVQFFKYVLKIFHSRLIQIFCHTMISK